MATKRNLSAIKSDLQKIAQDIVTTPEEAAVADAGPEAVMELVDDAIAILETAEEAIPAQKPEEEVVPGQPPVSPTIGAKTHKVKKAQDEDDDDEDKDNPKDAKQKNALDDDDDKEDKEDKEKLTARIAVLEEELEKEKKTALADEFSELVPETQKQAKYDEIVNSKEKIATLDRDLKVAKEAVEWSKPSGSYTPAKNVSGYISQVRKASLNQPIEAWKV